MIQNILNFFIPGKILKKIETPIPIIDDLKEGGNTLIGYENKNDPSYIPLNKLSGKNIDYLALGHIHKYNYGQIDIRGRYAYSGAIEGRGFDEIGPKGFVLLNIDEKTRSYTSEFISFAARTIEEILVDITDAFTTFDVINIVNDNLVDTNIPNTSIVRVVLTGEIQVESDININVVEQSFKDNFYYFVIKNDTRFKLNYSDYAHEESLKGEFVRLVANNTSLTQKDKMEIINIGIKALTNDLGKQDYEVN